MNLVKTIETRFDKLKRRLVKVLRFGLSDTQEPLEVGPYGFDSNPIKDMVALYSESGERGKTVIIGYLNKNQMAAVGESRIYSTDPNGELKNYIWLKNNGNIEIGGNANNLVRYNPLHQELQNLATFVNEQLLLISSGISSAGGAYTPDTLTIDISEAKTPKLKTD